MLIFKIHVFIIELFERIVDDLDLLVVSQLLIFLRFHCHSGKPDYFGQLLNDGAMNSSWNMRDRIAIDKNCAIVEPYEMVAQLDP